MLALRAPLLALRSKSKGNVPGSGWPVYGVGRSVPTRLAAGARGRQMLRLTSRHQHGPCPRPRLPSSVAVGSGPASRPRQCHPVAPLPPRARFRVRCGDSRGPGPQGSGRPRKRGRWAEMECSRGWGCRGAGRNRGSLGRRSGGRRGSCLPGESSTNPEAHRRDASIKDCFTRIAHRSFEPAQVRESSHGREHACG